MAIENRENKAHAATVNRIALRYGAQANQLDGADLEFEGALIEVETTATLAEAVDRLARYKGRAFVAVTNNDGVRDAMRLTDGTHVGVMDPRGDIVRDSIWPRRPR